MEQYQHLLVACVTAWLLLLVVPRNFDAVSAVIGMHILNAGAYMENSVYLICMCSDAIKSTCWKVCCIVIFVGLKGWLCCSY